MDCKEFELKATWAFVVALVLLGIIIAGGIIVNNWVWISHGYQRVVITAGSYVKTEWQKVPQTNVVEIEEK